MAEKKWFNERTTSTRGSVECQVSRGEHRMTQSGLERFGAYQKSLEMFESVREAGIEYGEEADPLDTRHSTLSWENVI